MDNHTSFIFKLLDVSNLLQEQTNLEKGLYEIVVMTAQMLNSQRCSIMLLSGGEVPEQQECSLRVFTHYGHLPKAAYQEVTQLNQRIAGYVAATGKPLLIKDITQSEFVSVARYLEDGNKTLMSVPILLCEQVIGVINVSNPIKKNNFEEQDLEILNIFAILAGKSLHTTQLQTILKSRFVEMAVACELGERYVEESTGTIPNATKLAKIVAKSFFRELTKAGFGADQIIAIATEVLNLLQNNLNKYKQRRERDFD